MVGVSYNGKGLSHQIWQTNGVLDSAIDTTVNEFQLSKKITKLILSSHKNLILDIYKVIGTLFILILAVIAIIPLWFFYITASAIVYLLITNKTKQIIKIKSKLVINISNSKYSHKDLVKMHRRTLRLIDTIEDKKEKIKGEGIISKAINKLAIPLKEIEQIERIAAFPEENEIVLSYDELKELYNQTQQFLQEDRNNLSTLDHHILSE